ncbi:hypothetical protein EIP91_008636 [Steccherinum ochraceum]|uniref:Outer spore wall protein RRT8 n=1 Tax=Steccherinum ochraceum TaxID=92696 RepID=A0A4R0RU02_9APHY|nr:hypothetical protein EIP91_008636 [Steccherinum ochraceum]
MSEVKAKSEDIIQQLKDEASLAASQSADALSSFAWLWPLKGILFSITHPHVLLSVRSTILTSLFSSALTFVVLAFLTYVPQAAFLSIFTGPIFGPLLALLLLGAESIFLLTFFARALFLEPALTQVFDTTLLAKGQTVLVKDGKTKFGGGIGGGKRDAIESTLVRPFQALSRDGIVKYLITLPLNLVPVIGTVAFLFVNGQRGGPGWHTRYFQLKGWDKQQRLRFVEKRKPEYTAFGMATMLFTFVPLVGLIFTFTNTVGAALWAADIEARANIIDPSPSSSNPKAGAMSNSDPQPPVGKGTGDIATAEDVKKNA